MIDDDNYIPGEAARRASATPVIIPLSAKDMHYEVMAALDRLADRISDLEEKLFPDYAPSDEPDTAHLTDDERAQLAELYTLIAAKQQKAEQIIATAKQRAEART